MLLFAHNAYGAAFWERVKLPAALNFDANHLRVQANNFTYLEAAAVGVFKGYGVADLNLVSECVFHLSMRIKNFGTLLST